MQKWPKGGAGVSDEDPVTLPTPSFYEGMSTWKTTFYNCVCVQQWQQQLALCHSHIEDEVFLHIPNLVFIYICLIETFRVYK